jgi:hypothetical protein
VSFVRPEIVERLRPWRESLIWGAGVAVGLGLMWLGLRGWSFVALGSGFLLAGASLGLLLSALRRHRLRAVAPDEGMVLIKEGRIGYLGPRGGGFLDLDELLRIDIVSDGHRAAWSLADLHGGALRIPVGARGADAIYDALGPFAQLDDEALTAGLTTRRAGRFPVWERPGGLVGAGLEDAARDRLP